MPYLQVDASQLEFRVLVELSGDEVALKEVKSGADIHSLNQVAFELPSRLIAKIYLFRTIFRGSGWSFANDNDFMHVSKDPKFWDNINEKFFKKYHGIDKQHKVWTDLVMNGKPIVGPLGRSWTIQIQRDYKNELKVPLSQLTNLPVQGTGADLMVLVRISFRKRLKALGIPCKLISTVHDSLVVDVAEEYLQQVADLFYQVFDDLQANIKRVFGYDWKTPMAAECKYGPNMRDMTKITRSTQPK